MLRRLSGVASRGRVIAVLIAACLVAGVAVVLGQDLIRPEPPEPEPIRPLSAAEADRLASMRQRNWDHARAGVRATIGTGATTQHLVGWVDWRRPMAYLARSGPKPGEIAELVQAVPGAIATRPGPDAADRRSPTGTVDPYPPPPAAPPPDGWQLRRPGGVGPVGAPDAPGTIDALAVLLLTITTPEPDAAELLSGTEARWLRRDRAAGHDVDVLLGPAIPPSPPPPDTDPPGRMPETSLAAMGGAVQYWLDDRADLHRLEALLAPDTPVRVDLDRTDRTSPAVLDLLGGAAVEPRPVTEPEAETLAQLRPRNLTAGGGEITLTVPGEDGQPVRATGWLDWRRQIAYLAMRPGGLFWADGRGVGSHPGEPDEDGRPPVPAPDRDSWEWSDWEDRGDDQGGFDVDLLLNEVLSLAGPLPVDEEMLQETAVWLREDSLAGSPVSVYAIPRPAESDLDPAEARLRYWVDDDTGVLVRLELRTRVAGFGQLDLTPGSVPDL